MAEVAIDRWRSLRASLGLLVLLVFALFALFPSILLLVRYGGGAEAIRPRNQQLFVYQALADLPFTVGAVLAVVSMRSRERDRSRRMLQCAMASVALGFGLLFLNAVTAPP